MSNFICGEEKWVFSFTHLPYKFRTIPVSQYSPEFQKNVNAVVGKDGCVDSREELRAAAAEMKKLTLAKSNRISAGYVDPKKPQVSDRSVTLASSNGDVYEFTVEDAPSHQKIQIRNQRTYASYEIPLRDFSLYGAAITLGKVVQIASNGQRVFLRFDNACDLSATIEDHGAGTFAISVLDGDFCLMGALWFATFEISKNGQELYLFGYQYDGHSSSTAYYFRN